MKRLLSCLALLLSVVICAFSEVNYVLSESFENGQLPEGWSQEFVKGQQSWVVESQDLVFPNGAADGNGRIALRNATSQTIGYTTRLVTPVMDLSEVFQPIVIFNHAQQQRTGDFDRLTVYYRTGADREWVELRTFDKKLPGWVQDTIELDAPSKTYQLAFEASDNFGRGVVLDNVRVRPMPTCDTPSELQISGLTTSSFRLRWLGSLDTDLFEILVNKSAIDPDLVDEDQLWKRVWVDPSESGFMYETGDILERNFTYYVYIRAHCSGELSSWADIKVKTLNVVNVPYFLDFNDWNYTPGTVMGVNAYYWAKGTDIESNASPFININEEPGAAATKQKSPDGTHCLVFAGANATDRAIPAGKYVYGATPEINVPNLKDLVVSFFGTAYQFIDKYNNKDWAAGLIVGVMTDPYDIETFVPVDTVWAKAASQFEYFQVPLSSYNGEGKYVAFMSRFDKNNLFYIDNLSIATQADYPLLPKFDFSISDANTITITPKTNGAASWDLFIAAKEDKLQLTPNPEKLLFSKTGITDDSFTVVADTLINTSIQIYVRVDGIFGLPEKTLMPEKVTSFPRLMSFKSANNIHKIGDVASNWIYTLGAGTIPEGFIWSYDNNKKFSNPSTLTSSSSTSISGYSDYSYAYLSNSYKKGQEKDIYVALPAVADVKKVALSFYMTGPTSSTYPEDIATIAIGVMTDPYDISTFVPLDTVVGKKNRYEQYMVSFEKYTGTGKFIALRGIPSKLVDNTESSQTMVSAYFDDIKIDEFGDCKPAEGIQKLATDTSIVLEWNANGANKWNVKLYSKGTEKKVREAVYQYTVDPADLIVDQDVTTPKFEKTGLLAHTEYCFVISTYCADTTYEGTPYQAKTDCAFDGESLPYFEGFEGYQSVGNQEQKIAHCWTTKFLYDTPSGGGGSSIPTQYAPYISNTTAGSTYVHSGLGYLRFGNSNQSGANYVALPKMNVDSVKRLQLSFWAKHASTTYADTLYVGVMTDPADLNTFDTVSYLVIKGTDWAEYISSFASYEGKGEYIALKKQMSDKHYFYFDDFKVKMLSNCGSKVSGVEAARLDTATAFKWTEQAVDSYELLIATEELDDMEAIDPAKVLLRKFVTTNVDTVSNNAAAFASNTQYYVYIRTYCSASNTGEWSNPVAFKTACMPETPESFGVEDFTNKDRLDCWTTGVNKVIGNPSVTNHFNSNGYLYLQNSKGTTTSLGQSYVIMPTLNVDSIKHVEITFQAHTGVPSNDGILDIGVCVDDFDSYMKVDTLHPASVASVAVAAPNNCGFAEALYYTIRFTDYMGDAEGRYGKKIVLLGRGNSVAANYIYIKNLSVRRLAELNEPINVTIPDSTITVGQAVVNWDAQDGATGYEIKYATAQIDPAMDTVLVPGTEVIIKTVTSVTNTVTLTELPGLTNYYVYVRSVKGEQKSIWSNMRPFKSSCPIAFTLPWSENFDSYISGATYIPDCWERFFNPTSASTATCCVYSSAKNGSAGNGLYMGSTLKNGPSYMVLPKMEGAVKDMMISFAYKSNAKTASPGTSGGPRRFMAIGVASDVTTQEKLLETVVWMDTIINEDNTNFKDYTFAFDNYTGAGEYIVFCGFGGNDARTASGAATWSTTSTSVGGIYIDDLIIEKIPTCFPASIEQVISTTSSITVDITDNFGQKTWDIAFVPKGGKISDVTPVTVNINDTIKGGYFLVEGLAPSTIFDVYVRANCGGGDVSKWSKPAAMQTLYLLTLDQTNWDFEYTQDQRDNYLVCVPGTTSRSYLIDPQFTDGNANPAASSSYMAQLYPTSVPTAANAAQYGYKSDFAMRLYSTSSYPTTWFALPEIDANMDTLQLRFDATSAYISNRQTLALSNTYAKGTYPHSVKVGIMEDPTDWSTFTELAEYVFPEVTATTADDDESHWNHYTLNLFGAKKNGKYIAFVSDYKATNYAYIDNVVVEAETGCGAPSGLNVVDSTLTDNSAEVVWISNKLKWNLQLIEQIDDTTSTLVVDSIVTATAISYETKVLLENLKPNTKYILNVKTICSDTQESEVSVKEFTTPCAPYTTAESFWNFEDNLVPFYQSGSTIYGLPECWKNGAISINKSTGVVTPETTNSNFPYAIANTSSYVYAQGTDEATGRALRFYTSATATAAKVVWAQMPKLATTEGVQLHFWARAAYCSKSTKKVSSANTNYVKKLYIGTMTDVDDFATFVKLDSVTYSKTLTTSVLYTDDEDELWEEFLVPLTKFNGQAPVLALIAENTSATYYFVDNLEVLPSDYCFRPTAVKADSVYSDRAKISWRAANRAVEIQLASDEYFSAEAMVLDTVAASDVNVLHLTDLPSETKLYLRARSVCSLTEKSEWVNVGSFLTLAKPFFRETFTELRLFPEDWVRYSKRMINVVDTIPGQIGAPISTTVTTNWYRVPTAIGMPAGHLKDNIYASHNTWIVSKPIDLTMIPQGTHVGLSFDLAMTDGKEHKGAEPDRTTGYDDAFVVAVTLDNAKTWSSEDLTVWANGPFAVHVDVASGDTTYVQPKYVYNQISSKFGGEKIFIDLSKYAGKIINFAFYGESTVNNADNDVHIDNVQINTYALNEYEQETCRWIDYEDEFFSISVDDYKPGQVTMYENYKVTSMLGADRLSRMNLTVLDDQRLVIDTTMCEGRTFDDYNFNIDTKQSGVFQQKLNCSTGCDSVVQLNLTVVPSIVVDTVVSICQGRYVDFCGERRYTSGNYECTYTSVVTGCDSIVRLHLTVRDVLRSKVTRYLCPDASIEIGDTTITSAGVYDILLDAAGCDSIVTLTVLDAPKDSVTLRAAIIEGQTYSEGMWRGLSKAGDYPITLTNRFGCDSVVTLHLMVVPAEGVLSDSISVDQLPYVLDGVELLDANTKPGTYTFQESRDGVAFKLEVTIIDESTEIVAPAANAVTLTPNPAQVGEPIRVAGISANATVSVVAIDGSVVYANLNISNGVIPGMPTAGIYLVSINNNGNIIQSKLIVR